MFPQEYGGSLGNAKRGRPWEDQDRKTTTNENKNLPTKYESYKKKSNMYDRETITYFQKTQKNLSNNRARTI